MTKQRPEIGVSVCVERNDELLLVQRGHGAFQGCWSLPGGHVEFGETLQHAVLRELIEETGVRAEIIGLIDCVDVMCDKPPTHYVLSVYFARWLENEAIALDDAKAVMWCKPDHLSNLNMTPGTVELIMQAWVKFASGTASLV